MTVNIFSHKDFQLKCIFNPEVEKFIRCLALNGGNSEELSVYFEEEMLIFNIDVEKVVHKIKCPEPIYIEYNKDNKLLVLTKKEELCYINVEKQKVENIKTVGKVVAAKWFPFNVSNTSNYF